MRPAGFHHTEETKARMSLASKGKAKSPEHRANMCTSPRTKEHRENISKSNKGQIPWNKGKTGVQVSWIKGKHQSMKTKEKISKAKLKGNSKKRGLLTVDDYDKLFDEQQGVCAICGKPETHRSRWGVICRLCTDHNHLTGEIRGLLCFKCNTGIGMLEADIGIELLENAIYYLKK